MPPFRFLSAQASQLPPNPTPGHCWEVPSRTQGDKLHPPLWAILVPTALFTLQSNPLELLSVPEQVWPETTETLVEEMEPVVSVVVTL